MIESNPTRNIVSLKLNKDNGRMERGLEIANRKVGQIRRVDNNNFEVLSQSGNGSYLVSQIENV